MPGLFIEVEGEFFSIKDVKDGIYGDEEAFFDQLVNGKLAERWDQLVADNALDEGKIRCWVGQGIPGCADAPNT